MHFKHVCNHLHVNNILTPYQSGFIPGDSTTNQLTFLYNTFSEALDSGKEVRWCSVISAKLLIVYGTKDFYVN